MRTLIFLLLISTLGKAQTLTVTGSWAPTLNDVRPSVAGSDYSAVTESLPNQVQLGVSEYLLLALLSKYDISVKKTGNLPSGAKLYVRRSGDGTTNSGSVTLGSYSGGLSYIEVTNSGQQLFRINVTLSLSLPITLSFQNIPIQYKLEGLSVTQPTGNHNVTVTYTVSK
jgi:hypothetical protein